MKHTDQKPVALVTGGAQGIGLGTTKHLLTQGWQVAIADINEAAGQSAQETLAQFHDSVLFVPCDPVTVYPTNGSPSTRQPTDSIPLKLLQQQCQANLHRFVEPARVEPRQRGNFFEPIGQRVAMNAELFGR